MIRTHSTSAKVLKAMSLFGGVQAIGIACSVIRAKLVAIWIGPMGVALLGIFNSALDMVAQATQLSVRQSSVRDISDASIGQKPKIAGAVRWWSKRLALFGAVAMMALSPALSFFSFGDTHMWWAFACLSLALFCVTVSAGEQAIMQGYGQLRALAKCGVWGAIGGTAVAAPLFYFFGIGSIIPSIIVFSIATLVAAAVLQKSPAENLSRQHNIALGKGFIKFGAYLTVSGLLTTAASYILLSYLNQSYSTDFVGFYQVGYVLVMKYVGLVFTAIAMEYYPRLVKVVARPGMASRFVSHEMSLLMCVIAPVAVCMIAFAPLLVRLLYTSQFLEAVPMIIFGVTSTVFRVVSYCMSYTIVASGDGRTFIITDAISVAVGLALNIVFCQLWGLAGIGISFTVWYAIYSLIVAIPYYRKYHMWISRKALAIAGVAGCIVILAAFLRQFGVLASCSMLLPCALMIILARNKTQKNKSDMP